MPGNMNGSIRPGRPQPRTATTTFTLQGTTSPRTGDAGVGIYIACVVLSMTGGAYLFRKKRSYN